MKFGNFEAKEEKTNFFGESQYLFEFENGFGASVLAGNSYTVCKLKDGMPVDASDIVYCDDEREVEEALEKMSK